MIKRTYERKPKSDVANVITKTTSKIENNALVTGISRSGRVRKKSSKLIDYESGAEENDRPRRKAESTNTPRIPGLKKQNEEFDDDYVHNEISFNDTVNNELLSDSEPETNAYPINDGFDDSSVDSSGSELEEDLLDDKSNIEEEPVISQPGTSYSRALRDFGPSTSQKSLYMLEKFSKKKKNGRTTTKTGRKDKGKARFSAYMLWAREVRPDLMKSHPNIDFSHLSSKLSDLWATVPYSDKYMWKQKAKRMAMMAKNVDNREEANLQKAQYKTSLQKKFINKKATSPPKKRGAVVGREVKSSPVLTEICNLVNSKGESSDENKTNSLVTPSKNVSTGPLDVAAHLKLLGESLSIIGQRLKEHEGQIAVSGSLSVLLDSLLCSLGPLLCLTQQVEEMNGCPKETLESTLDNIAYIMPGL